MSNNQGNKNLLNNTQKIAENMAQRVLDNTSENSRRTSTNNQGVNNSYSETPTPSINENEGSNTVVDNPVVNNSNNENNNSNNQRNKNLLNNTQKTAENAALRVLDNTNENPENSNTPRNNNPLEYQNQQLSENAAINLEQQQVNNEVKQQNNSMKAQQEEENRMRKEEENEAKQRMENEINNTEFKQTFPNTRIYTQKSLKFGDLNESINSNQAEETFPEIPKSTETKLNFDNSNSNSNNENNTGNNTGEGVNSRVLKTSGAEVVNETDNQVNKSGPNTGLNNVSTNNAQLINNKLPAGPPESNNNMGPVDKVKNLIDRCNNLQDSYNLKHKEFMYLNNLIENTLTELNNVKMNNSQINSAINKLLESEDKLNNRNLQDKLNEQKAILEKLTGKLKEHQISTRNNEKKILNNHRAQIEAQRASNLSPQLNRGPLEILKKNPKVQEARRNIVKKGNLSDLKLTATLGKTIKKRKRKGKSGSKKKKGSQKKGRKSRVGSKRSRRIKIVRRN